MIASRSRRPMRRGFLSRRRCCCTRGGNICLSCDAANPAPVPGATIALYSGGVQVASCTTDAAGCCTFGVTGTFDVRTTAHGVTIDQLNKTLSSGSVAVFQQDGNGVACCHRTTYPAILTLTDSNATVTLAYLGGGTWTGCYLFDPGVTIATSLSTGSGPCPTTGAVTLGTGSIGVGYFLACDDATGLFTLTIRGSTVWSQNIGGVDVNCGTYSPPWTCGSCGLGTDPTFYWIATTCADSLVSLMSISAAPTGTSPFAWSGTFPSTTGVGPVPAAIPAPGTVAITG